MIKLSFLNLKNSAALLTVCAIVSCSPEKQKEEPVVVPQNTVTKPRIVPPEFNGDSAYAFVKAQADMGPRVPGSKAHEKSVIYFKKQFERFGAQVMIQSGNVTTFDKKSWVLKNVIASINPTSANRIILAAHYDSRPFSEKETDPKLKEKPCPGVNDGASGAGVLLEVARILQQKNPEIGVDIILFDLEDYGMPNGGPDMADTWCLGAQYWSKNPHKQNYTARFGVLLDMVGAKDAMFAREGYSVFYANDIVTKVWKAAEVCGSGKYFNKEEYGEITDDHFYINKIAQIPCIDILHYDIYKGSFFDHHHKNSDDLSTIDKNTLKGVGQTLLEVIYNE
ncbi:MAG: glutamine cyclotransferase [Bacteroidetes bacterium]|nr:glutamine cyclotransferase [Bacteroidota bacterium]